jgi:hypothetical protein
MNEPFVLFGSKCIQHPRECDVQTAIDFAPVTAPRFLGVITLGIPTRMSKSDTEPTDRA